MWTLRPHDSDLASALSRELGISQTLATLLSRRVSDAEQGRRYLEPRLADLTPPTEMANLAKATERLKQAIVDGEQIGIFGDYDVDGVSSAALIADYLQRSGANVTLRVARRDEGYGFSTAQAEELVARGAQLQIVTDCGTSDLDAVGLLAGQGVDVIAIDHHRVGDELSWPGFALINPHQPSCGFPFKGLCSVGLAFYVMARLRRDLERAGQTAPDPREALDLVAVGTLADVAPLADDNRILVSRGLIQLAHTDRPGLRELMRLAEVGRLPTVEDIGWRIGPRLNAPGRLGDAAVALECLWLRDPEQAAERARACDRINKERREIQERILAEAHEQVERAGQRDFYLLSGDDWHPGVIGIVAGRITEATGRPAAVVAMEGETGRASARSIEGVDLYELLNSCQGHLLRYGGHAAAAGFSVAREALEPLSEALNEAARAPVEAVSGTALVADAELPLAAATFALCDELDRLGPFGEGNQRPMFVSYGLTVADAKAMGNNHFRATVKAGKETRAVVAFSMGERIPAVGSQIDLAFVPEIDTFRGRRLRLRVIDLREHKETDATADANEGEVIDE